MLFAGCGGEETQISEPLTVEAGFVEIEPIAYTLRGEGQSTGETSSRARLFWSFHPANDQPEKKPLIVMWSGGPGASTGILLGGNTSTKTVDPARTGDAMIADDAASWTAFANVLHVDARGAGLSYGVAPNMEDPAARAAEFTERNWNPYLDAADGVRVVLRFLSAHPALARSRVVLAGESYGGVRTEIALHLLHFPERYETATSTYEDPALAKEIRAHFDHTGATAESTFDRAVLLQPRLTSPEQQAAAGVALEAPDSPLFQIAKETSVAFVPCAQQGASCSPYPNVVAFLQAAGRDLYDVRKPAGDELARYAALGERLATPSILEGVLGVPLDAIEGLSAKDRAGAYRLADEDTTAEPLATKLGSVPAYDRYFAMELFDLLGAPFVSAKLRALGVDRTNSRFGLLFLEDLLHTSFFVTNAAHDAAIWTPSLPAALARYTSHVAGAHADGETLVVDYVPGAFGVPAGTSRSARFPKYEASGHSIALDEPDALAADVAAWLDAAE